MPPQGDPHVVHLHGDGIAAEQALVQQFDTGALDETQLQQASLQFDLIVLVVAVDAHLDDDTAIAPSGLAQLYRVGQFNARKGGTPLPSGPAFL